jgi:hypothetical protein
MLSADCNSDYDDSGPYGIAAAALGGRPVPAKVKHLADFSSTSDCTCNKCRVSDRIGSKKFNGRQRISQIATRGRPAVDT